MIYDCIFWSLISNKEWDLAQECLQNGYALEPAEDYRYGPLYTAMTHFGDSPQIIDWLLDHGANIERRIINNWTPLHMAVNNSHLSVAKRLIDRGANINARTVIDDNFTPLMIAAYNGNLAIVNLLLSAGADTSPHDVTGRTAATIAEKRGHRDVFSTLSNHSDIKMP
jgi:ankyrin repeat protein